MSKWIWLIIPTMVSVSAALGYIDSLKEVPAAVYQTYSEELPKLSQTGKDRFKAAFDEGKIKVRDRQELDQTIIDERGMMSISLIIGDDSAAQSQERERFKQVLAQQN